MKTYFRVIHTKGDVISSNIIMIRFFCYTLYSSSSLWVLSVVFHSLYDAWQCYMRVRCTHYTYLFAAISVQYRKAREREANRFNINTRWAILTSTAISYRYISCIVFRVSYCYKLWTWVSDPFVHLYGWSPS